MKKKSLFITPKEMAAVLDKSYSSALRLKEKIRDYFDKEEHHQITFVEFANYLGISEDEVRNRLETKPSKN